MDIKLDMVLLRNTVDGPNKDIDRIFEELKGKKVKIVGFNDIPFIDIDVVPPDSLFEGVTKFTIPNVYFTDEYFSIVDE